MRGKRGKEDRKDAAGGTLPTPVDSPHFDLRFEGESGVLSLARPLDAGLGAIETLELSLGRVAFPLDVTQGQPRFRTRNTRLRRMRVRLRPAALLRAASSPGLRWAVADCSEVGAWRCAVHDESGWVGFDLVPFADGADLLVHIDAVRCVTEGPRSPWKRLLHALGTQDWVLDRSCGALRLTAPMRQLLVHALVMRGWRLPDVRACELSEPRHLEGELVLEAGSDSTEARAKAALAAREVARRRAPALALLADDDTAGALDSLQGTRADLERRRQLDDDLGLDSLIAAVRAEGNMSDASAPNAPASDPMDACLALRAGVRDGKLEDARVAADHLATHEPVAELAVEGLVRVARALADEDPAGAHALIQRAVSRCPRDVALQLEQVALAELVGDLESLTATGRRALAGPLDDPTRASVTVSVARALERLGQRDEAERFFREALHTAPADPGALEGLAGLHAARGDRAQAVSRLDRAAAQWTQLGNGRAAARAARRAAELLVLLDKPAAAEERLQAVLAHSWDADLCCALARVRIRMGCMDEAASAYEALLDPGPSPGPSMRHALSEAACFHLDDRADPSGAQPFVEMLARRTPSDPRLAALTARLSETPTPRQHADPGGEAIAAELDDLIEDTSDPGSRANELVRRAREVCTPQDLGPLAERLAAEDRMPSDPDTLAFLERHAIAPTARAALAQRLAESLRGAGQPGAAALALARAGHATRDSAVLRAALELAESAGSPEEVQQVVALALDVVGEGPARRQLLSRQAAAKPKP